MSFQSNALALVAAFAVCLGGCGDGPDPAPVEAQEPLTAAPLRPRAVVEGARFRRVDPAACGLDFANLLRPENVVPYVYSGSGVAVGDYDGDGLPDVYLPSQDGPNRLFRQVAPWQFEDVTAAAFRKPADSSGSPATGLDGGDAWGSSAAFADIDNDGDLDLYVGNTESPNLLFVNQGDGSFLEQGAAWGLDLVAATTGTAFADYDNDGDLDVYVLTNRVFGPSVAPQIVAEVTLPTAIQKSREEMFPPYPRFPRVDGRVVIPEGYEDFFSTNGERVFVAAQRDYLMRNDGGKFVDASVGAGIAGHGSGLSATWWDADGDGWLDLYVANDLESPDQLYRNRRDGTFEEVTRDAVPHTAFFGMGSDFGDIDNDGRFDFLVADMSSTTHYMSKMLMGSMGTRRWFLMNADPQQYMRNALFVNAGGRRPGHTRFVEAGHLAGLASTDWTWTVRFADLDEDGLLDAFVTNGIPAFEDNPDTVAEFQRLWREGEREAALELARNLPAVPEKNIARRNAGELRFEDVGAAWGLDDAGVSQGAVLADLDRDGDLDILVNNQNAPVGIYENLSTGTHRILVSLRGAQSNSMGVGAKVELTAAGETQTRLIVLARGYMGSGEAVEHFGLGPHDVAERLVVTWPSGVVQAFDNLAADHHYTLHEAAGAVGEVAPRAAAEPWFEDGVAFGRAHVEREFDDYEMQPLLPHRLSRLGPGMAWGDADGDGRDDVWLGGAAGQSGSLWCRTDAGGFRERPGPWRAHAEREDLGAVFLDFDSDGDRDLFVVSGGVEAGEHGLLLRDRLYVNDGAGQFEVAADGVLPVLERSGSCVCAADFDRDGDVDLFVGSRVEPGRFPLAPGSVLLRNDGGRFVDVSAELAPTLEGAGMVTGAVWSDVDGDGAVDLVLAAQWQPLRLLLQREGRLIDATAAWGLDGLTGQWNSVDSADLDGDGDMDVVALNLGLNTKYTADAGHELKLFARDFDGNQVLDVIEAKGSGGDLLPVRGLSCSSQAMPFLSERFPTYDAFARANLGEIYGAEALSQCVELSVRGLSHVVLENLGDRFEARDLPRRSQVAPGFGVGVADFDGDGHLDVVFAQNSFSPEPETGRHDGGVGAVLAGRAQLGFAAVDPNVSGVDVPQDAQALAVLDLDGDGALDLVITTNDGPLRVLRGAGGSARALGVRLVGAPGNPDAVGARVEVRSPEGRRQVAEVRAGHGYLTQAPAVAWFTGAPDTEGWTVDVRWPDGTSTQHPLARATGVLVLERD